MASCSLESVEAAQRRLTRQHPPSPGAVFRLEVGQAHLPYRLTTVYTVHSTVLPYKLSRPTPAALLATWLAGPGGSPLHHEPRRLQCAGRGLKPCMTVHNWAPAVRICPDFLAHAVSCVGYSSLTPTHHSSLSIRNQSRHSPSQDSYHLTEHHSLPLPYDAAPARHIL